MPINLQMTSTGTLDRLLSAANEFDASDLHLVPGVPRAFRVNASFQHRQGDAQIVAGLTQSMFR